MTVMASQNIFSVSSSSVTLDRPNAPYIDYFKKQMRNLFEVWHIIEINMPLLKILCGVHIIVGIVFAAIQSFPTYLYQEYGPIGVIYPNTWVYILQILANLLVLFTVHHDSFKFAKITKVVYARLLLSCVIISIITGMVMAIYYMIYVNSIFSADILCRETTVCNCPNTPSCVWNGSGNVGNYTECASQIAKVQQITSDISPNIGFALFFLAFQLCVVHLIVAQQIHLMDSGTAWDHEEKDKDRSKYDVSKASN